MTLTPEQMMKRINRKADVIDAMLNQQVVPVNMALDEIEKYESLVEDLPTATDEKTLEKLENNITTYMKRLSLAAVSNPAPGTTQPATVVMPASKPAKFKPKEVTHDGRVETFRAFWHLISTDMANGSMDEDEKLRYIRSAVSANDQSFVVTMDLKQIENFLKEKYGSPTTIRCLIKEKFGSLRMRNKYDAASLQTVKDVAEHMRLLAVDTKNTSLLTELFDMVFNCLSENLQEGLLEKTGGEKNMDPVKDYLTDKLKLLAARDMSIRPINKVGLWASDCNINGNNKVSSSLYKRFPVYSNATRRTCNYCKVVGHFVAKCPTLAAKQCFKCGQMGHMAKVCMDVNPPTEEPVISAFEPIPTENNSTVPADKLNDTVRALLWLTSFLNSRQAPTASSQPASTARVPTASTAFAPSDSSEPVTALAQSDSFTVPSGKIYSSADRPDSKRQKQSPVRTDRRHRATGLMLSEPVSNVDVSTQTEPGFEPTSLQSDVVVPKVPISCGVSVQSNLCTDQPQVADPNCRGESNSCPELPRSSTDDEKNQIVEKLLRACEGEKEDWERNLLEHLSPFRSTRHSASGIFSSRTPLGHQPRLDFNIKPGIEPESVISLNYPLHGRGRTTNGPRANQHKSRFDEELPLDTLLGRGRPRTNEGGVMA